MLIADYAQFVEESDLTKNKIEERREIALYGLAGEIGSLIAAIKKRLLAAGRKNWDLPNHEITEELGDSIWYCFALAEAYNVGGGFLVLDIQNLQTEISGGDERAAKIRQILGDERVQMFLEQAPGFGIAWTAGTATLDQYQCLAFMTSRTKKDELVEVCLAVLQQLVAELFRTKLPPIERDLNSHLPDRPTAQILGETAWHLSALASLYQLSLSEVVQGNIDKLRRRFGRDNPTPLKDAGKPALEQLPRHFEIVFVTIGKGRSRMYLDGRQLGDDLTDNAYTEDGYRFHDVMHLVLAAKLGWSPVLRKLLGRKRKSDPKADEVEDGARAAIVEEAVIKAIHTEGLRLAALQPPEAETGPGQNRLFANGSDISFSFLKRLGSLVEGLEAEHNQYWEWEEAIVCGFDIFHRLRSEGQGTVTIDLEERSMKFSSDVLIDLHGKVAALGTAIISLSEPKGVVDLIELNENERTLVDEDGILGLQVRKLAILNALGLPAASGNNLRVGRLGPTGVSVSATGEVRTAMWDHGIVCFRVALSNDTNAITATAIGICDD